MWEDIDPKDISDKIVCRYKQWGIRQWDNEYDLVCTEGHYISCYKQNVAKDLETAKTKSAEWILAYYKRCIQEMQDVHDEFAESFKS